MLPRVLILIAAAGALSAQDRRARIDVEHYVITADVNGRTQSVAATAQVKFVPLDDNTSSVTFDLHNSLNVSRVVDAAGNQIPASRNQADHSIRLNFPAVIPKGQAAAVTFTYDGRLSGGEESPIYGIKFAAVHPDYAYLMYPARWFPVSGYTTDRYTAELNVSVNTGYKVISPGIETQPAQASTDKKTFGFKISNPSFPGSIAVVKDDPGLRVSADGVMSTMYFRGEEAAMANVYGQEAGKIMAHFASQFGTPQTANLSYVQTETGAPNGYSAPGIIFLSPRAIAKDVNVKILSNQIARQWWGVLTSPATRNHLWLANGLANYSEALYLEHTQGPGAMETAMRDAYVEALTVDNVPMLQAARLEDYSPELNALTASKGAAATNMLRFVIGDPAFFKAIKDFAQSNAGKSVTTAELRKAAETAAGQSLDYFFLQWAESSGAPEFKLEYTIFRTQKGFRALGKVSQDLDTFRMPVLLKIETEGNPEEKTVEVVGTSSEFSVDTFGKPKAISIDPNNKVLRYSTDVRLAVAIRRGEQFAEVSEYGEALKEYQKALEAKRTNSLAHYRIGEIFFLQNNYQSAANEFREALAGDLQPKWTEVWSHIQLGKIFDITGQRARAVNEYKQAERTKDNTQGALEEAAKYSRAPYERAKKE